jgi:hypothetical protein
MRRFDKKRHIAKTNRLIEERYLKGRDFDVILTESQVDELLLEVNNKELLKEFNEIFENKVLITESLVLDVIAMIKSFLTSHRVGELVTALTKWILKITGIDKDMDGVRDKCQNLPDKDECSKMWIQRLSELLEKVHHKIDGIIRFVIAAIKYKTFRPSKEQKASVEKESKRFFTAIVIGCLIYYAGLLGINITQLAGGVEGASFLSLIIPAIGTVAKVSDLNKKFKQQVSTINNDIKK